MNFSIFRYINCLGLCFCFVAPANAQSDESADLYKNQARSAIERFQTALKAELMSAMKSSGPRAAIAICNEKAPEIAAATSNDLGLKIGRTSHKLRNKNNAPDEWEKAVLEKFLKLKDQGSDFAALEDHLIQGDMFRYMKAIPTKDICAICHGQDISPSLYEQIIALYPDDQAIGFNDGDIRGAFSVSIPMHDAHSKENEKKP